MATQRANIPLVIRQFFGGKPCIRNITIPATFTQTRLTVNRNSAFADISG